MNEIASEKKQKQQRPNRSTHEIIYNLQSKVPHGELVDKKTIKWSFIPWEIQDYYWLWSFFSHLLSIIFLTQNPNTSWIHEIYKLKVLQIRDP